MDNRVRETETAIGVYDRYLQNEVSAFLRGYVIELDSYVEPTTLEPEYARKFANKILRFCEQIEGGKQ